MSNDTLTTDRKALQINRDADKYGTFAEIGAGQEVARWFFHVGGAAGTVAKTISAYDMAVSDAIYGPADRYVSRQRLQAMLQYEFSLLLERLDKARGDARKCFVFANTVAMHSFTHQEEGHGWLGIRFQTDPRSEPSDIIIHVRMLDKENARQQEALGVIGVNLIHGAFSLHCAAEPAHPLAARQSHLGTRRGGHDPLRRAGVRGRGQPPDGAAARRAGSHRGGHVHCGRRDGAMERSAPQEARAGPARHVPPRDQHHARRAWNMRWRTFVHEPDVTNEPPVVLMEMTLRHLATGDAIDHQDFLQRADMLRALGRNVLISNFRRLHRLAAYLGRYTDRPIGLALGAHRLAEVFDERYYNDNEGGLLGGLGQLFKNSGRLYVYPSLNFATGQVVTMENFPVAPHLRHLYAHLTENRFLRGLANVNVSLLRIRSRDVLDKIAVGDVLWEQLVPPVITEVIKRDNLFGWRARQGGA